MREMIDIREIDTQTIDGQLLLTSIAKITTESQIDKTPDEVLCQLNKLRKSMFEIKDK